jgi:hypothetical protein
MALEKAEVRGQRLEASEGCALAREYFYNYSRQGGSRSQEELLRASLSELLRTDVVNRGIRMKQNYKYVGVAILTFAGGVLFASLGFVKPPMPPVHGIEQLHTQVNAERTEKRLDFAEAFQDFVYVGSSSADVDNPCPVHGFNENRPRPQKFETGVRYFFHLPSYEGKEFYLKAFYVILRDRFQAQGISSSFIMLQTSEDYSYFLEHPGAEVKFWGDACEGEVIYIPQESISKGPLLRDYVLTIEKCGN